MTQLVLLPDADVPEPENDSDSDCDVIDDEDLLDEGSSSQESDEDKPLSSFTGNTSCSTADQFICKEM